jgi:hypothetical protein
MKLKKINDKRNKVCGHWKYVILGFIIKKLRNVGFENWKSKGLRPIGH